MSSTKRKQPKKRSAKDAPSRKASESSLPIVGDETASDAEFDLSAADTAPLPAVGPGHPAKAPRAVHAGDAESGAAKAFSSPLAGVPDVSSVAAPAGGIFDEEPAGSARSVAPESGKGAKPVVPKVDAAVADASVEDDAAAGDATDGSSDDVSASHKPRKRKKRKLRRAKGQARTVDDASAASDGASSDDFDAADAEETDTEAIERDEAPSPDDEPVETEDGDSSEQESDAPKRKQTHAPSRRGAVALKVTGIVFGVLAIAVIISFAVFLWDRWALYDDAADIQGTWAAEGGTTEIEISGDEITLSRDATLDYTIDPFAKTLTYSIGDLSGAGRYRFSPDRQQVAIEDGQESWFETLLDDLAYSVQLTFAQVTGGESPALALDPEAIVLSRDTVLPEAEVNGLAADPGAQDSASIEDGLAADAEAGAEGVDDESQAAAQ